MVKLSEYMLTTKKAIPLYATLILESNREQLRDFTAYMRGTDTALVIAAINRNLTGITRLISGQMVSKVESVETALFVVTSRGKFGWTWYLQNEIELAS